MCLVHCGMPCTHNAWVDFEDNRAEAFSTKSCLNNTETAEVGREGSEDAGEDAERTRPL